MADRRPNLGPLGHPADYEHTTQPAYPPRAHHPNGVRAHILVSIASIFVFGTTERSSACAGAPPPRSG